VNRLVNSVFFNQFQLRPKTFRLMKWLGLGMHLMRLERARRLTAKGVFCIGALLFLSSFLLGGFGVFYLTAWAISDLFHDLKTAFDWRSLLLAVGLLLGWLSNASVFWFARLAMPLVWASIAAPWIAFLSCVALGDSGVLAMVPFYPWAVGLGLIHFSRLMDEPRGWLPWFRPKISVAT